MALNPITTIIAVVAVVAATAVVAASVLGFGDLAAALPRERSRCFLPLSLVVLTVSSGTLEFVLSDFPKS